MRRLAKVGVRPAQILELMRDLQAATGTTVLMIIHDMRVVAEMADRGLVMNAGRMVEQDAVAPLFASPREAYTRTLLAAAPIPDPARERLRFERVAGKIPSPVRLVGQPPARLRLRPAGPNHLVAAKLSDPRRTETLG